MMPSPKKYIAVDVRRGWAASCWCYMHRAKSRFRCFQFPDDGKQHNRIRPHSYEFQHHLTSIFDLVKQVNYNFFQYILMRTVGRRNLRSWVVVDSTTAVSSPAWQSNPFGNQLLGSAGLDSKIVATSDFKPWHEQPGSFFSLLEFRPVTT